MKKFSFTFWISWVLLADKKQVVKITGVSFVKYWSLTLVKSEHHGYWYCTENLNEKNVLCICLLFFLTVTKIYDYILNIWTNSLWKCQGCARQNQDLREKCRLDFAEGHEKLLQSWKLRSSRRDLWNNIFWVQLERQGIFMVDLILACRTKKKQIWQMGILAVLRHDARAFYPDLFLCNCCH